MIESQVFNARDAERMKRELQAVEREAAEAEDARNASEVQSWDLDTKISHILKELEGLSIECNQALRRLNLGINLQYQLNAQGTTPSEVMGIDYKVELKPALESFVNDIKKSSMERMDTLITLQRQSVELANKIEEKRNRIASLEMHIDEVEQHLTLIKKETEDHISRCELEKTRAVQDFQTETHNLEIVETEAANMLEGVLVSVSEEGRFMLDGGTGVIGVSISGDFLQRRWEVGMYVMVVGQYLLRAGESPVLKVHKIVDLSEFPDREAMWYLELMEAD